MTTLIVQRLAVSSIAWLGLSVLHDVETGALWFRYLWLGSIMAGLFYLFIVEMRIIAEIRREEKKYKRETGQDSTSERHQRLRVPNHFISSAPLKLGDDAAPSRRIRSDNKHPRAKLLIVRFGDFFSKKHSGVKRPNENKMSCCERERASWRVKGWKSWKPRSYAGSQSAPSSG